MEKGSEIQAKRVGGYSERDKFVPSYWKVSDGTWLIHFPDERAKPDFDGATGGLQLHKVEEHEDGTITVTPSILIHNGFPKFDRHGFLTRGVWREV